MTYAGDVTPAEAYAALLADPRARLVDVRSSAEWAQVGVPDLSGVATALVRVEWNLSDGSHNDRFVAQLREELGRESAEDNSAAAPPDPLSVHDSDAPPVFFLCRSGVRSAAAARAATQVGLGPAYNVMDGFEGPMARDGQRSLAGWKVEGLPWQAV